jgi:hypothetical protein
MGLDSLTRASFEERDGRWIFYPYSVFSRGFVLANDQKHVQLRRFVKRHLLIGAVALFLPAVTVGPAFVALTLPPTLLWYTLAVRRLTRGLPFAQEQLALRDNISAHARRYTLSDLWTLEITFLLFVAASLWILVAQPESWLVGVVSILVCAVCAFAVGLMIGTRWKQHGQRN